MVGDAGITAIYATQYGRTQQTVQPLATALTLPIKQIESSKTADLVEEIQMNHRGGVVFVAGHNNTVPAIIAALGAGEQPLIPEHEYDNMFVVSVYRVGKAKVVRLKFGSALPAPGNQQMIVKP